MPGLKINPHYAGQLLSQLDAQISQQQHALRNGATVESLATSLEAWHTTVQYLHNEITREKSMQLGRLQQIAYSMATAADRQQTLQAILDALIAVSVAERGMLIVLDPEGQPQIEIVRTMPPATFSESEMIFARSVIEQTLEKRNAFSISDNRFIPRFQDSVSIIGHGLHAILCIPLIHKEETLGAVYLDNHARTDTFTEETITMLNLFAAGIAVALSHAREQQKSAHLLAQKAQESNFWAEMTGDLNANLPYRRVMERSLNWAITASGAEAGAIGLLTDGGISWISKTNTLAPDHALAMRCIIMRAPRREEHRLVLPLLRDNRPVGVLYLTTEQCTFDKNKQEFVLRVADAIAISVDNTRLYEGIRQTNLEHYEFLAQIIHALRTPMACIFGYAEMLRAGLAGTLPPQQQEFINIIAESAQWTDDILTDAINIVQLESGQLRPAFRRVDVQTAIAAAIQKTAQRLEKKHQTWTVDLQDDLPPVYADPERLSQLLESLLRYAIQYTAPHGHITLKIWRADAEPDFIHCAVISTQTAIGPDDQARMFDKFHHIADPATAGHSSTGLELAIAKNLVEMHGGRLWLDGGAGQGSTFHLTLPVAIGGDNR